MPNQHHTWLPRWVQPSLRPGLVVLAAGLFLVALFAIAALTLDAGGFLAVAHAANNFAPGPTTESVCPSITIICP